MWGTWVNNLMQKTFVKWPLKLQEDCVCSYHGQFWLFGQTSLYGEDPQEDVLVFNKRVSEVFITVDMNAFMKLCVLVMGRLCVFWSVLTGMKWVTQTCLWSLLAGLSVCPSVQILLFIVSYKLGGGGGGGGHGKTELTASVLKQDIIKK